MQIDLVERGNQQTPERKLAAVRRQSENTPLVMAESHKEEEIFHIWAQYGSSWLKLMGLFT